MTTTPKPLPVVGTAREVAHEHEQECLGCSGGRGVSKWQHTAKCDSLTAAIEARDAALVGEREALAEFRAAWKLADGRIDDPKACADVARFFRACRALAHPGGGR